MGFILEIRSILFLIIPELKVITKNFKLKINFKYFVFDYSINYVRKAKLVYQY